VFICLIRTFAANYSYHEKLIQAELGPNGTVRVTNVTAQGPSDFVTIEVTRYGETRDSWCVVKDSEVVQCMDNGFYGDLSH
jgi:hypothetical protein